MMPEVAEGSGVATVARRALSAAVTRPSASAAPEVWPTESRRLTTGPARSGAPGRRLVSTAARPASSSMHSPRAACHSSAADSAVVRAGARTATVSRNGPESRPNAAAPARNPVSTSSPLGVSPGPLPSKRVAAAVAAWWLQAAAAKSASRPLSIPGSALLSAERNSASALAATSPRASRAGAHSLTARTTTGPAGPVQRTSPFPTTICHDPGELYMQEHV